MERLTECLKYIDPDDYDTWYKVGMALKHEGYSVSDWDIWSQGSKKYKSGVCEKKWDSFEREGGELVTGGTIWQMAKDNGYEPEKSEGFGWDDEVEEIGLDYKVIDKNFVREISVPTMKNKPIDDLIEYLTLVFKPDEYVGYCDRLTEEGEGTDKKYVPKYGIKSRTAGELIKALKKGFENASILPESPGGAMIRFNPLDGQGESDGNVTDYRYCMVESDKDSIEKQYALYKEMQLPIVCLVYSGNKSIHAIIKVDAATPKIYRERVNFIYDFCRKNGLMVDENDKNASRYSRMPGIKRNGNYQYIIETNIGKGSYDEWREYVDLLNDNLPKDVTLDKILEDLPPLKDELISGILRVGHKMLLAAPSKAGKSFLLMNLTVCFAEGLAWLGHKCKKGKVLYVNLELDEASCFQRFAEIYKRIGIEPKNASNITVWNLRGRAVPMDKLTPFMINRYREKGYVAIIIDPIYKVMTGDENDATEMGVFCSYFDRAAIEIDAAMIYCHHHSKGASTRYSNAVDRASGSGVFTRDPDAILDMSQLELTDAHRDKTKDPYSIQKPDDLTGWEIDLTLREFPPMKPVRVLFDYPLHIADSANLIADADYAGRRKGKQGVGADQKSVEDIAAELEALFNTETFEVNEALQRERVMDELSLSDKNLGKHTGPKTKFEPGTLTDGTKVVFRRGQEMIKYGNTFYKRPAYRNKPWAPA